MNRIRRASAAAVCIAVVGATAACSARSAESGATEGCSPGITDTTLLLGGSLPMSGAAAVFGRQAAVAQAYFDDINAAGGVEMGDGHTRTVKLIAKDDAYDPARTVSNVRSLVEQDNVFGLFQVLGTSPNLAIADYVSAHGIPNLIATTGSDEILAHHDTNPWTIALAPQYNFEAEVISDYILDKLPEAKVAILYQNDGFGKQMLANFHKQFDGTSARIVAEQGYEQSGGSVDSQMTSLANSGADVFLNYASGTFVTQAFKKKGELRWDAMTALTSTATYTSLLAPAGSGANDIVAAALFKDVSGAASATDPGVQAWSTFAAKHNFDATDDTAAVGYSNAQIMIKVLEGMSGCTRQAMLDSATSLKDIRSDLTPPGVTISTTPRYPYLMSQIRLKDFNDGQWVFQDELYNHESRN